MFGNTFQLLWSDSHAHINVPNRDKRTLNSDNLVVTG